MKDNPTFNPFPGLRPFQENESHLFFGREGQSDELLRRLRRTRFLAVVGTSGSGKSSLMRAGLLPALHGGMMAKAGASWHVALMRPGADPLGNLARALHATQLFPAEATLSNYQASMLRASLSRSSLGLIETCKQAPLPANENLLVVVDQFEELFRFKNEAQKTGHGDEAATFVQLLLEAASQQDAPIYVVLTMRSDFLGDCAQFQNLPEAINDGQYLIPRMTREQRRSAITGPIGVAQGEITPRLVNRVLNDVGDNPDQLPILQHALMRTWDYWQAHRQNGEAIDLPHYDEIGGMLEALSKHADKAYDELPDKRSREIAEIIFKRLTEKGADNREVRRPTLLQELVDITEASVEEVIAVIERFRQPGRSFLMPPAGEALLDETLIDISHESLIRNWKRLKNWVEEEAESAKIYLRLADTAGLHQAGKAGFYRDPELQMALDWREQRQPNADWAKRYRPEFDAALSFLQESVVRREAEVANRERQRKRELKRTRFFAFILGTALVIASSLGWYANQQRKITQDKTLILQRTGLSEKVNVILDLLSIKPVEALSLAIQATGQSLSTFKQVTTPTLASLNSAVELAREKNILKGHKGAVLCLALDPNGKYIVTGGADSTLRLWDFEGNFIGKPITGHRGTVTSLAISSDGKTIFSASSDMTIRLWNKDGNSQERILFQNRSPIHSLVISPTSNLLAFADKDSSINLWDLNTFKTVGSLRNEAAEINAIAFSPDGKLLASANNDATITLWDISSQQAIATLKGHKYPVHNVAFSHDGKLLASCNNVRMLGILSKAKDGVIKIWNLTTLKEMGSAVSGSTTSLTFSPEDHYIISGDNSGSVQVLDINGNLIGTSFQGHDDGITAVAVRPDGQTILSSSKDGTIRFWDFKNIPTGLTLEHAMGVNWATFDPTENYIITGEERGRVQLWNRNGEKIGQPFKNDDSAFWFVTFSPDSKTIAVAGHTLQLWNLKGERIGQPFEPHGSDIWSITFSPNGQCIATGSVDNIIRLWDLKGNQIGQPLKGHKGKIWSIDFSSDGKYIVSGSADSTIRLWDNAGHPIGTPFSGHQGVVTCVVFLPNNRTIASSSGDGTIRLWNLEGKPEIQYKAHNSAINCIDVSLDGRFIVSGSAGDGMLRIWQIDATLVFQTEAHNGQINSVNFSPNGNYVVTASTDKTVRLWSSSLWNSDWQKLLKTACDRLRNHPYFKNLETTIANDACQTCEKYIWGQVIWSKNKAQDSELLKPNLWQPAATR